MRAEQLAEEQPNCASAFAFLSRLVAGEGDLTRARTLFERAKNLDPSLSDEGLKKTLATDRSSESKPKKGGISSGGDFVESVNDDDGYPRGGAAFDLGLADFRKPKLAFKNIGGTDALKEEIRMKIIYPLQHAELFKAYDKKVGGGVLLYGPPGCGKTLISKATAGEIQANFISLGLHQIIDMWIGKSEKNMHEVF